LLSFFLSFFPAFAVLISEVFSMPMSIQRFILTRRLLMTPESILKTGIIKFDWFSLIKLNVKWKVQTVGTPQFFNEHFFWDFSHCVLSF
jgi:hypothetical protein